jgi:hypothetical protein
VATWDRTKASTVTRGNDGGAPVGTTWRFAGDHKPDAVWRITGTTPLMERHDDSLDLRVAPVSLLAGCVDFDRTSM